MSRPQTTSTYTFPAFAGHRYLKGLAWRSSPRPEMEGNRISLDPGSECSVCCRTPISLPIAFRLPFFSHVTVPIATLARLELEKQSPGYGQPRPGFEIQPAIVLRGCKAWTVVVRNSRNARVFGARYWRGGIISIPGETFLLPIRKEGHQSSTRQMGIHAKFENLSDPISCQAHSVHGCDVTQHELALRLNLDLLSTFTECPLEGTAPLPGLEEIDHPMPFRDQLLRVGRVAVFLQVAGRGYGSDSRVQQSSGDKSGWARLAEANSPIVWTRDQISEVLPRDQVHLKLRICFEKSTELRSEDELREVRVHVDAESSRTVTLPSARAEVASSSADTIGPMVS